MKVKTADLSGAALRLLVARLEGYEVGIYTTEEQWNDTWADFPRRQLPELETSVRPTLKAEICFMNGDCYRSLFSSKLATATGCGYMQFDTNWGQSGPIIDREGIAIRRTRSGTWYATKHLGDGERAPWTKFICVNKEKRKQVRFNGPTALIAGLRCYVASQMGDEVDVPEEIME